MEQFVIQSKDSLCRKREGGAEKALKQDIIAFYHDDYQGGGNWRVSGTIENLICTFKNDITPYTAYSGGYPFSISGDIRSVPS